MVLDQRIQSPSSPSLRVRGRYDVRPRIIVSVDASAAGPCLLFKRGLEQRYVLQGQQLVGTRVLCQATFDGKQRKCRLLPFRSAVTSLVWLGTLSLLKGLLLPCRRSGGALLPIDREQLQLRVLRTLC